MTDHIDWIAADWGTTNLRLWAMQGDRVIGRRAADCGMGTLAREEFAPALARETAGWPTVPVIACGMVGARQGWVEAPYATVPCRATPQLLRIPGDPGGRAVWIACGVKQDDPPDVMRGEETQIAGLLAGAPDFDGVICLPGTHTKWARISVGEICHFQSFMTGEIFSLLSRQSVLRHTVNGSGDDQAAFDAAAEDALSQPHRAYGRLFQLRAGALLGDLPPGTAASRLSGMLIGWELAAARPYWLGLEVALIGNAGLSALYARALAQQGVTATIHDTETATLAGLHAAWLSLGATA